MTQDIPQSDQAQGDEKERAKSRDPLVGTVLDGRFQIEDVLGSGGMSVVYKATQLRVNRHVAIKTLRLQLDEKDIYRERFQREISSLCALNHPNIVTVYDALIGPDDQPYVVMDYLRGRSLEALIEDEGPMSIERFARISIQICSALEHAHKKGIIHRDLKPGNIVLMDNEMDFVKVVDFGLAKIGDQNRRLTHSGELWGSPPYMSPEQCMGEALDQRSDLYSIGAVMYEMLTGYDPYRTATSVFEFIRCHTSTPPPAMQTTNPLVRVPQKIEAVVFKALEKSPDKRYQTAKEMQDAIVEACSGSVDREQGEFLFHLANQASTPSTPKSPTGQQAGQQAAVQDERVMTPSQAFNMALNPFSAEMLMEPQASQPSAAAEGVPSSADRWRSPGGSPAPASQSVQPHGEIVQPVGEVVPTPGMTITPAAQIPLAQAPAQSYAGLDAIPTPPSLQPPSLQSQSSPAAPRASFANGSSPAPGVAQSPAAGLGAGRLGSPASPSGGAAAPPARMSRPGVDGGQRNSNSVIVVFLLVLAAVAGLIYFVPSLTGKSGSSVKTAAPATTTQGASPAQATTETGASAANQSAGGEPESTIGKDQSGNTADDATARNHAKHSHPAQRTQGSSRAAAHTGAPPPANNAPVRAVAPVRPRPAAAHSTPAAAHPTTSAASHPSAPAAHPGAKADPWSKLENLREGK